MSNYDSIDCEWTWDGDFTTGITGDLGDTSLDLIQAKIQEVQTVIKSEIGDWKEHKTMAADLSEFRGEPNTRETGEKIRQRVFSVLTSHNVVKPEDLQVKVVPVHIHQVLILIRIAAQATPANSLVLGQPVVVTFIYDSTEDSVWYIPENQIERNYFYR